MTQRKGSRSRPLSLMQTDNETFSKLQEMEGHASEAGEALRRAKSILMQSLTTGELREILTLLKSAKVSADAISAMHLTRPIGHQDYASHTGDLLYDLMALLETDSVDQLLHAEDVNRALAETITATKRTEHLVTFGKPIPQDEDVSPDEMPTREHRIIDADQPVRLDTPTVADTSDDEMSASLARSAALLHEQTTPPASDDETAA